MVVKRMSRLISFLHCCVYQFTNDFNFRCQCNIFNTNPPVGLFSCRGTSGFNFTEEKAGKKGKNQIPNMVKHLPGLCLPHNQWGFRRICYHIWTERGHREKSHCQRGWRAVRWRGGVVYCWPVDVLWSFFSKACHYTEPQLLLLHIWHTSKMGWLIGGRVAAWNSEGKALTHWGFCSVCLMTQP